MQLTLASHVPDRLRLLNSGAWLSVDLHERGEQDMSLASHIVFASGDETANVEYMMYGDIAYAIYYLVVDFLLRNFILQRKIIFDSFKTDFFTKVNSKR